MSRNPADAEAAAKATVERFGRIDVLVNYAASFYAGYFEELSPRQMNLQLATSLVGPMNVTRACLPLMRKQGSVGIIAISSTAGPWTWKVDSVNFGIGVSGLEPVHKLADRGYTGGIVLAQRIAAQAQKLAPVTA